MLNKKRQKVEIRTMERDIKKLKDMWLQENLEKTDTDWQQEFKEDEIRSFLLSNYVNANDYLITTALHASIKIRLTEKHITQSTIIPNLTNYTNGIKPVLPSDRN